MHTGRITIITGPMFSEKSGELIRRCQKLIQYGHRKVVAYKPAEDNRYAKDEIVSRIGYRLPAISIPKKLTDELVQRILEETKDADVVAFDEVQFFSRHIMTLVEELAYCGKHVIADGLNLDYRGKEFGYVGGLLAMADDIEKLASFCAVCGSSEAVYTQRMVNGKPSTVGPIVMIGDSEAYEPRCRNCFIPPHKVNCD